jgi:hypothetical protein
MSDAQSTFLGNPPMVDVVLLIHPATPRKNLDKSSKLSP